MKSSVIGIVFDSEKKEKVLIVQRCDVPVWVLPGGGVDFQETPENAVVREVFEETGMKVSVKRKVAEYTPINKLSYFTHVFECVSEEGALKTGTETRSLGYYPIEELPKMFFIVHLEWLADALQNDPEILRKPIANVTYFKLFKFFIKHPWVFLRFAFTKYIKKG